VNDYSLWMNSAGGGGSISYAEWVERMSLSDEFRFP